MAAEQALMDHAPENDCFTYLGLCSAKIWIRGAWA